MDNTRFLLNKIEKILKNQAISISTAESCTGGILANMLTSKSGSSGYFNCGLITYQRSSKEKMLKISKALLDRYGTISRECARIMAKNLKSITKSDITISTTGVAGPSEAENKPAGVAFVGIAFLNKTRVKEFRLQGTRLEIRKKLSLEALKMLYEELCKL
ncbi:MAG: CinA family protein [Candidatus Omnitrophica bacterium]|nr:CinA family protein [Candidatus Omnitrophota bacterium]